MKNVTIPGFLTLLILTGCSKENSYNESASLSDSTKISSVLEGKVLTSMVNKKEKTMATLYGNDIAVEYARNSKDHKYPAGSELSLVTWSQKEDVHWYGANIPGEIKSVEIVKYQSPNAATLVCYQGKNLELQKPDFKTAVTRIAFISNQRAAVLP